MRLDRMSAAGFRILVWMFFIVGAATAFGTRYEKNIYHDDNAPCYPNWKDSTIWKKVIYLNYRHLGNKQKIKNSRMCREINYPQGESRNGNTAN